MLENRREGHEPDAAARNAVVDDVVVPRVGGPDGLERAVALRVGQVEQFQVAARRGVDIGGGIVQRQREETALRILEHFAHR